MEKESSILYKESEYSENIRKLILILRAGKNKIKKFESRMKK